MAIISIHSFFFTCLFESSGSQGSTGVRGHRGQLEPVPIPSCLAEAALTIALLSHPSYYSLLSNAYSKYVDH